MKNYNEETILVETAKIIVKRLERENKRDFSTQDFICKLTGEDYVPSRDGNYNSQWGVFLSAHAEELVIRKKAEKESSPMVWEILKGEEK